jgi:hypothetical protein
VKTRTGLLIGLGLLLLAGSLRFYRLGEWPFWRDEGEALAEVASFSGAADFPKDSPIYRLPRIIPFSYTLLSWGQRTFGADEFGSRVVPALFGVAQVLLIFFLLDRCLGRKVALVTALLFALWPEHINRSQENRFYTTGAFFASLCMLAGALAVRRRSLAWAGLACVAATVGVFVHSLLTLLFPALLAAFFLAGKVEPDTRGRTRLVLVASVGFVTAIAFVVLILPLARGWNEGETFGYGVARSLLAAAALLGWPVLLLAGLGLLGSLQKPTAQDAYWATWAGVWVAVNAFLPLAVVFHPEYGFLFALGILVPAGRAVVQIYQAFRLRSRLAGYGWLAAACLLNLPSLASHYSDGSRLDFREPARFIAAHCGTGDRVSSFAPRVFRHYGPADLPVVSLPGNPEEGFPRLGAGADRLWIVAFSQRGGKDPALEKWLGRNCTLQFTHRPRRFDYYENVTEVYLYVPPSERLGPALGPDDRLAGRVPADHPGGAER